MSTPEKVILILVLLSALLLALISPCGKYAGDPNSALPWLRPTGDFSEPIH